MLKDSDGLESNANAGLSLYKSSLTLEEPQIVAIGPGRVPQMDQGPETFKL